MFSINNKMISSVPIHHNSFANELLWRSAHFPMKQESLDESATHVTPEIFADTDIIDPENELEQLKSRSEHLARFIPPTISTSPTMAGHQGIYVSPTYQQRDFSAHFKMSPNRMSPYRRSPNGHHKTSPTSILSSPSPSGLYHQKISPTGCDMYPSSTPDKFRASPSRNSDLYRTSSSVSTDYHHISPTSHTSGGSSHFSSDQFQSPQSYSHLSPSMGMGQFPNDIYRSLNFNLPKTPAEAHSLSPRMNSIANDEPLNMNSKQLDLSQGNQRLSPYSDVAHSPSYLRNSPSNLNDQHRGSPINASSDNPPFNQESHGSTHNSRSPSPIQNLKEGIRQGSNEWNVSAAADAPAPSVDCTNDVPSLKCYFCSYNTKSRIQLNKHMRDAHNESKIMPFQHNKESTNESEDENENETHSNLSEDFMMDEYDEEDPESEEFAVNISKVSQNANNNKRTNYKCKKCTLTFKDKDEYYVHQKDNHIKKEKLLECKLCPFVTEYKHHHEYHIKNHFKMKPFKCSYSNCKYSCNNQSMLNSHVKSHKSFYQFHCKNCNYATKYMHSFKLHLRKNNHEKGITLNEDGSVNNDIIIDIHGTRRGPKRKSRKLDDIALQNINNNNCITETIKKTIHHEPDSEFNNNVTMSSNNGSSRSNSPLSNIVNYNNNNNDSYYLNTKLFVYPHMASMMNEKTPEIWPKNFAKMNSCNVPEVVDLSDGVEEPKDMTLDVETPLDLSKSVDNKPDVIHKAQNLTNHEILQTPLANKTESQGNKRQSTDTKNALIKIENKVKTSADMIRIVGKNNFNFVYGNVFKNKNRIKLCKNGEKSIKQGIESSLKSEIDLKTIGNMNKSQVVKINDNLTPVDTFAEDTLTQSDITEGIINNDVKMCDKTEDTKHIDEKEFTTTTSVEIIPDGHKKSPDEDTIALSEANQKVISSNKNRRRKGKAYKLQVNNDNVDNVSDEYNVEEEQIRENNNNLGGNVTPKFDSMSSITEEVNQKEPTFPSTFEAMQMDYLKQIQNQYFKTFQQNKCLENCVVPPSHHILSNLNNNINSSLFDSKSQPLNAYHQTTEDLVGSHLKNLERINTHLLQNSLNIRQKSEGLKSFDNILSKKADAQKNLMNFLNKRNEMTHNVNNNRLWYKCELCDIQYLDELIYSIHMRYHNVEHPYKCNLCGLQTNNKFQFNLHIIQTPH